MPKWRLLPLFIFIALKYTDWFLRQQTGTENFQRMLIPLRSGHVVALEAPSITKIQTNFEFDTGETWQLRVSPGSCKHLRGISDITVSFIIGQTLYTGTAILKHMDPDMELCIITDPDMDEGRPIRRHTRLSTRLSAAIIIMGSAAEATGFIYRADNIIVNISRSGVQIACRKPISKSKQVLLVTSLIEDEPHHKEEQIYLHATIMREAEPASGDEFPYSYGLQFHPMFPQFRQKLDAFLESIDRKA